MIKNRIDLEEQAKKILIIGEIEDKNFPSVLKQAGYDTILFAQNGEEGLKMAFRAKPEFVCIGKYETGKLDFSTTANIIYEAYNIPVLFVAEENSFELKEYENFPLEVILTPVTESRLKFRLERAKQAVTRFRKLSERYELVEKILSHSPGFALVLDERLYVKYISERNYNDAVDLKEFTGRKFTDLLNEQSAVQLKKSIDRLECGNSSSEKLILTVNSKNAMFDVACEIYCDYGKDGKSEFFLYCNPKKEILLASEGNELVSVLENVPYGVAVLTGNKFDFVNPEFEKITGYSIDEITDLQDLFEKMFPDRSYRRVVISTWNNEIERKNIFKTLSIQCKNGDIKQIDFRAKKIDSGKYIISVLDITEQKKTREELDNYIHQLKLSKNSIEQKNIQLEKLNEELRESEEKLLELNRDKDKFFSILAHDLRTPFNAILGLSQLVADDYDELTKEEVVKIVKDINKAGKNLFRLLENLLNWSRVTSGRAEFNPEKIDLFELVLTAVHLLKPNADTKEITIENNIKPNTYVFVDEQMIESVIENLLTNAIKFTPRGGKIAINISEQPDRYEVSVSDTGVGISKENIGKLFRIDVPFSEYGTEKEKGSGLGLILCKENVEKHNGKIWVESEPGKGSTFYFTVPKAS